MDFLFVQFLYVYNNNNISNVCCAWVVNMQRK